MYRKIFLGVVFLAALFTLTQAFRPVKCRGKDIELKPEEMERMEECVKEYSTGGSVSFADVPITRIGCVGKCILKKEGLADEKGMPVKDNVFKMINGTLDDELLELAAEKLGKCIDEKSSGIDVREKACKTYWPLVQCVIVSFQEICADPATTTTSTKE